MPTSQGLKGDDVIAELDRVTEKMEKRQDELEAKIGKVATIRPPPFFRIQLGLSIFAILLAIAAFWFPRPPEMTVIKDAKDAGVLDVGSTTEEDTAIDAGVETATDVKEPSPPWTPYPAPPSATKLVEEESSGEAEEAPATGDEDLLAECDKLTDVATRAKCMQAAME